MPEDRLTTDVGMALELENGNASKVAAVFDTLQG